MDKRISFNKNTVTLEAHSWDTGKPIVDAMCRNGVVLLIFDYMQYPENKVARNLEGYNEEGEHTVVVSVTDGISTVSQDVKVVVTDVNRPPEVEIEF